MNQSGNKMSARKVLGMLKDFPEMQIFHTGEVVDYVSTQFNRVTGQYDDKAESYPRIVIDGPDIDLLSEPKEKVGKIKYDDIPDILAKVPTWSNYLNFDTDRLLAINVNYHQNPGIRVTTISPEFAMDNDDWWCCAECFAIYDYRKYSDKMKVVILSSLSTYYNIPFYDSSDAGANIALIEHLIAKGAVPLFWVASDFTNGEATLYMAESREVYKEMFNHEWKYLDGKFNNNKEM